MEHAPIVAPPKRKAVWASKTLWINLLALADQALGGPLSAALPPDAVAGGLAGINIALRFLTDSRLVGRAPRE